MYVSAQRCVGHDKAPPESGRASIVSCYHSSALRSLTHIKLHGANLLYFSSVDLPVLWATNVLVGHDARGRLRRSRNLSNSSRSDFAGSIW
jgi:hypothetical protein